MTLSSVAEYELKQTYRDGIITDGLPLNQVDLFGCSQWARSV